MSKIRKNKIVIIACLLVVILSMSIILFTGCTASKYNQLLKFLKANGEKDSEKDEDFGYQYRYSITDEVDMYYYTGREYNDEISFSLSDLGSDSHIDIGINQNLKGPYTWGSMYLISGEIIFVSGTINPSIVKPGSITGITIDNIDNCPYGYEEFLISDSKNGVKTLLSFMHLFFTYNEEVPVSMVDLGFVKFTD